jgi:hypothetical protein
MSLQLSITTTDLDNHQDLFAKLDVIIQDTPGIRSINVSEESDISSVVIELKTGYIIVLRSKYDDKSEIFKCYVYNTKNGGGKPDSTFNWHPFNEMGGLDLRKFRQDYIDYVIKID